MYYTLQPVFEVQNFRGWIIIYFLHKLDYELFFLSLAIFQNNTLIGEDPALTIFLNFWSEYSWKFPSYVLIFQVIPLEELGC